MNLLTDDVGRTSVIDRELHMMGIMFYFQVDQIFSQTRIMQVPLVNLCISYKFYCLDQKHF